MVYASIKDQVKGAFSSAPSLLSPLKTGAELMQIYFKLKVGPVLFQTLVLMGLCRAN